MRPKDAGVTAFCAKPLFMSDLKNAPAFQPQPAGQKTDEEWSAPQFARNARIILLVEDLILTAKLPSTSLRKAALKGDSAPDGSDAVEMVRNSPENYYSAILMDVQMPTMNGLRGHAGNQEPGQGRHKDNSHNCYDSQCPGGRQG